MIEGVQVVAGANGWPLWERTGELLVSAARGAIARDELELAESLARSARHLPGGWPAGLMPAEVLVKRGRYGEAARVLPGTPPGGQRPRWAVIAAEVAYLTRGDVDAAARVLGMVGGSVAGAHRAWILLLAGRCRAALAAGEVVLHGRSELSETVVLAAAAVTLAAGLLGQVERASTAYERGREAARQGGDPLTCTRLGYASRWFWPAGWVMPRRWPARGIAMRCAPARPRWLVGSLGVIARFRGDISAAVGACREAIDLLDGRDVGRLLRPVPPSWASCSRCLATGPAPRRPAASAPAPAANRLPRRGVGGAGSGLDGGRGRGHVVRGETGQTCRGARKRRRATGR